MVTAKVLLSELDDNYLKLTFSILLFVCFCFKNITLLLQYIAIIAIYLLLQKLLQNNILQ